MDREQRGQVILTSVISGVICAVLAIAGTFFTIGQRTAKLETQVEYLKEQIKELKAQIGQPITVRREPEVERSPEKRVKKGINIPLNAGWKPQGSIYN